MGHITGEVTDPVELMIKDLDLGFTRLVEMHQGAVYSVALRFSGDRRDAEDLAAETFLRAYRVLRDYDQDQILALRPRPWLMTILLNLSRNRARDRSRRPTQVPLETAPEPAVREPDVAQLAEENDAARRLGALLAELSVPQRAAVVLRHVVGYSVAEIAEVLGCPEGTVKSHISRGLARLREIYPE